MKTKDHKQVIMKMLIIICSLLIISAANIIQPANEWKAPPEADKMKNPFEGNTDATKKGKSLYNKMCNFCHGDRGKGDGIAGMALNPRPTSFILEKIQNQTDGAIFWKITEGKTPMASYKETLTEEQRWQLVNYIRELAKK